MKKIFVCQWCFKKNRVNVTRRPESGMAYCGNCGNPVAKYTGSNFFHKCEPVVRKKVPLSKLL